MSSKEIKKVVQRLEDIPEGESRVLLATGKFVGEGFDDSRLDTLLLTLPISWKGTIAQYVGRLHRLHDCKQEVQVYDYADLKDALLQENGYTILRFLAEYVGKRLDEVLDSILRCLVRLEST